MISDRLGRPTLFVATCLLIWGLGFTLVIPWADSLPLLLALVALVSFVVSLTPGPIVALAGEVLRPHVRSAGMGIFYTVLYAGLALGPVLAGFVSDTTDNPAAPVYLIAVLSVLAVLVLGLFRGLQARGVPAAVRAAPEGETAASSAVASAPGAAGNASRGGSCLRLAEYTRGRTRRTGCTAGGIETRLRIPSPTRCVRVVGDIRPHTQTPAGLGASRSQCHSV